MPIQPQTEKALEWVFKVATALAIPAIIWSFKLSSQVAVLENTVQNQKEIIKEVKEDVKEAKEILRDILLKF